MREKDLVFIPQRTDEISLKLSSATHLVLSKASITIKDDNGKTRGVVRNIVNFSTMQIDKRFSACQELKKVCLDNASRSAVHLPNSAIYLKEKQVYILNNTKHAKFLSSLTEEETDTYADEITQLKLKNDLLKKAEANGAIVINY